MVFQLFRGTRRAGPGRLVESALNMAEEQFQIPIHYRVEIGEEFPEQRENPNTPRWEALVEIPDEVQRTVKAKKLESPMACHGTCKNSDWQTHFN